MVQSDLIVNKCTFHVQVTKTKMVHTTQKLNITSLYINNGSSNFVQCLLEVFYKVVYTLNAHTVWWEGSRRVAVRQ